MNKTGPIALVVAVVAALGLVVYMNQKADSGNTKDSSSGDTASIEQVVAQGGDLNKPGDLGSTPLMDAARQQKVELVKKLIAAKVNVNATDVTGRTAHMWALYLYSISLNDNFVTIMELLLDAGADYKMLDNLGKPALITACNFGSIKMVDLLLRKGASPDTVDKNGNCALVRTIHAKMEADLSHDIVKMLLDKGANPSFKGPQGDEPLMHAAGAGHLEILKLILSKKVNVNAKDKDGKTPLMHATQRKQPKAAAVLRAAGAV